MVQAYADGQLDVAAALDMERHLKACASCAAAYRNYRALSTAIGDPPLYYKAPASLNQRLAASLGAGEPAPAIGSVARRTRRTPMWRGMAIAASAVFLIAITAAIANRFSQTAPQDLVLRDVVQSHVRSLMVNHLADVISSNQHTVKPWFNGKLDFAPPVNDLAAKGFPLAGGRVDVIEDRPVAALIYRAHAHYINLFIWPSAEAPDGETTASRRGYNVIHWNQSGMAYWAVSDLNLAELKQFANLLRPGS
jgi:anti-sigma factor RsiW